MASRVLPVHRLTQQGQPHQWLIPDEEFVGLRRGCGEAPVVTSAADRDHVEALGERDMVKPAISEQT